MTMTCKMNKLEKPGGPLRIFHTLFGRSAAFYGHFRADTVTSELSTRILHHLSNRYQCCKINNTLGDLRKIIAGVPLGIYTASFFLQHIFK